MKKFFFLSSLLALSLSSNAQLKIEDPQLINTDLNYKGEKLNVDTRAIFANMYYFRPNGVFYSGWNENFYNPQCAYMPADTPVTFKAYYSAGSPVWEYPAFGTDGTLINETLKGEELTLSLPKGEYFTPILSNAEDLNDAFAPALNLYVGGNVTTGTTDYQGQTVSNVGFASNYVPIGLLQSVIDFFCTANESSDMQASSILFNDEKTVHTLGFAETFASCARMYVKGFNTILLTFEKLDETTISKVHPSFGTYGADGSWNEIAGSDAFDSKITELMPPEYGPGFYYVEYSLKGDVIAVEPENGIIVKLNSDEFGISPAFDCQDKLLTTEGEDPATGKLITAFIDVELNGERTLMPTGLPLEDGAGGNVYLNSWMIGLDMSYDEDVHSGITTVGSDIQTDDVYNIAGVKVSANGNTDNLPAGIYVIGGRKIIKR